MNSPNPLSSGEPSALGFLPGRFEPLHRRFEQYVEDGQHAGVSLLLARNGKIADTFATGFRDRELGLAMSRDTIVRVYSMTKIVVSVAALTLLEEGKLGLLDPVADYLPEFRDLQVLVGGTAENPELVPADKPLTIQHLFTHTSGIIYEAPGELIGEIYRPMIEGNWRSLEELAVPFINLGVGHGFGLGVGVRIDDGLSGTLGTLGAFGWSGMATTYCRIDPAEKLVALCFAQHLPFDEHGLFQRFANLSYQALA